MQKELSLGNRTLSYLDVGEGPVLLLGHSYLWNAEMWSAQVEALSTQYRCIVPELWGHGQSGPVDPCEIYTLDQVVEDMLAFVEALAIDTFIPIGLSVGGMWAPRLAHRLPEQVEKLVIMDSDVGEEPAESQAHFLGMIGMAAQAGGFPPPLIEACLPFFFCDHSLKHKPELVETFRMSLSQWPKDNVSTVLALGKGIFTRPDFLKELEDIQCPALVMCGEEDRSRPPAEARRMAERLPNARLELIPQAGHIATVEQPETVNRLLVDFLNG